MFKMSAGHIIKLCRLLDGHEMFMLVIFTKISHKNSSLVKLDKNIRTLREYLSVFYFFMLICIKRF